MHLEQCLVQSELYVKCPVTEGEGEVSWLAEAHLTSSTANTPAA